MVAAAVAGLATSTRTGLCRNAWVRRVISGRHCGGEEQRLACKWRQFENALDVGDEAHVEHAVGFVDDHDLHAGQEQLAAFEMIEQTPGRGDQHVDAARRAGRPGRRTRRRR